MHVHLNLYRGALLSGAGTNLKVGGTGPLEKNFVVPSAPPLFWL